MLLGLQSQLLDDVCGNLLGGAYPWALLERAHNDVLHHAQARKRLHQLKGAGKSCAADLIGAPTIDTPPRQPDLARVRTIDAGNQIKAGGLARTVGTNQAHDFSRGDVEARLLDGFEAAEALRHAADLEQGGHVSTQCDPCRARHRASAPWPAAATPRRAETSPRAGGRGRKKFASLPAHRRRPSA